MLHLKLDLVACCNFSWRKAHNKILLRRSIALDNLRKTLPPIDEDQRLALLHARFTGTTLFGGELAKLQEVNTKRAATFTVFPITKPGQSKEVQTTMTVSIPQDSNKHKVEPLEIPLNPLEKINVIFEGKVKVKNNKDILSCTNSSKQQEISQVCLRKQGLSVSGTALRSEHSPSEFYLLGAHRLGISVIPYLDNWLVHHPDRQVL